jgi:uncharacterized protein YbaR (Trm112 family)
MFIELVDLLRCPTPHEDSWLVASVDRMENRIIVDGVLGCPVCLAQYPIRSGVLYFVPADPPPPVGVDGNPDDAMRLAAALALTEPRVVAVLSGRWTAQAPLIRALSPSRLILLNPVSEFSLDDGISAIMSDTAPFALASVNAIAIDENSGPNIIETLVRALQPGGRALGPATVGMPAEINELARDSDVWVGEKIGDRPGIVTLGRRATGGARTPDP